MHVLGGGERQIIFWPCVSSEICPKYVSSY